MLTAAAGLRSSKGGILRAAASKLCVEKQIVGMMRGVGIKCCTTNPIFLVLICAIFIKNLK